MRKFNTGDLVRIKTTSKSKFKEAIGTITGYCHGDNRDICRVKLWRNKIIQIYDYNLTSVEKEN